MKSKRNEKLGVGASNLCYGRSACKWRIVEKEWEPQHLYTKRPPLLSMQSETDCAGPVVLVRSCVWFQNKVVFLLRTVTEREGSKILSMQTKFWPTESFKGSFLGTEGRDMVTQRQWILAKPFFLNGPIKLRRCVSFAINQKVSFYIRLAMWCLIKN